MVFPSKYTRPIGRVSGPNVSVAVVDPRLSPPMTPALFSAMSRPETAPMSAVIDPMTRGAH